MNKRSESLGIKRIAALHMFVRDLERSRDHFIDKLDFAEIAVSGREFELVHRARASVVQAGAARIVLMEPLGSKGESFHWLERHPEGIGRIVFEVHDVEHTFHCLIARGATAISGVERRTVDGTPVAWFDIATPIGDTLFRFVQHPGSIPIMPELVHVNGGSATGRNRFGVIDIDHITCNFLTLKPVLLWMEHVMGFDPFWKVEFHTQDVKKGQHSGSGLKSVVMRDPGSGLTFANNEPAPPFFESSQIYVFCKDHGGPGVQHVALGVADLITAVGGMRSAGAGFMKAPQAYYDMLPKRPVDIGVNAVHEDVEALRAHEILVDGSADQRYLLQVFMLEAAAQFNDPQAGPVFIELIQRKGDQGFGAGNFRALFESIELQLVADGRA